MMWPLDEQSSWFWFMGRQLYYIKKKKTNNNVLKVHFILNQVLMKKHASNYLQNLQPKRTKVSFCNLITQGEKEEGKKEGRGREGAERCTPNY